MPRLSTKFIVGILVFSVVTDALNTVLYNYGVDFNRVSVLYKALVQILMLLFFIKNSRYLNQYLLLIYFFFTFSIGALLISINTGQSAQLEAFVIFNKYLYFVVISLAFLNYHDQYYFIKCTVSAFEKFILLNSAVIILSFFFGIDFFSTYEHDRFGYKGFIPAQNETTGVYFFAMAYYCREYFKKRRTSIWQLVIVSFSCLLVGTKGCWIIFIVFLGYFLLRYKTRVTLLIFLPVMIPALVVYAVPLWNYLYNNYLTYFIYFIERSGKPWYYIMLSGRNEKTQWAYSLIQQNWSPINYFFGGTNLKNINSETDFVDGFFLFGVNFIVYLIYYFKFFLLKPISIDHYFILIIFIILAGTGGHLIYSAIVPFYLLTYVFSSNFIRAHHG